ncbi:MAG: UDP-N-acetylmuramoyl-L-alanine--D-glutamate ligase [Holosporaceae bacterium]|jgi:UDP-N-acetylmuramoylalanine--D-glutamate ligase|nr:UDP-N-acetylmuramoyl-L-alanine--D-glutamate ligase [Holosporaceae bacterium]
MISLDCYRNKRVGVIGLGKTGQAVVAALREGGAHVSAHDDFLISGDQYNNLELFDFDWSTMDFLVISPGVNLLWPNKNLAVELAQKHFVPIINDIDLFQSQVLGKKICLTGTNGKSTTAALIDHIFKRGGKYSSIGGNFGNSVFSLEANSEFYVLELSSYQLESCNILGFDTAVLLNIRPDHLARHGGMAGYVAAKQKIFGNFGTESKAVIGIDDEHCLEIGRFLKTIKQPNIITVSGEMVPDLGVGWSEESLIDNRSGSFVTVCAAPPQLDGVHNRQNIAAAYAVCVANGLNGDDFCKGLCSFDGLEHRQEFVDDIYGIHYINDSKATNADAAEQALRRFNKIIWILGGRPKENGIFSLVKYFPRIKFALLIGEAAEEWSQFLEANGVGNEVSGTLDVAVSRANEISKKYQAEVVLLSPACASFDQFKDFEDRGNRFKKLVGDLRRKAVDFDCDK